MARTKRNAKTTKQRRLVSTPMGARLMVGTGGYLDTFPKLEEERATPGVGGRLTHIGRIDNMVHLKAKGLRKKPQFNIAKQKSSSELSVITKKLQKQADQQLVRSEYTMNVMAGLKPKNVERRQKETQIFVGVSNKKAGVRADPGLIKPSSDFRQPIYRSLLSVMPTMPIKIPGAYNKQIRATYRQLKEAEKIRVIEKIRKKNCATFRKPPVPWL